jgi:hypothetical protein
LYRTRRSITAQEAPECPGQVSRGIEWGDWLILHILVGSIPNQVVASPRAAEEIAGTVSDQWRIE